MCLKLRGGCIAFVLGIALQGIRGVYKHFRGRGLHIGKIRHTGNQRHSAAAQAENACNLRNYTGSIRLRLINLSKGVQPVHSLFQTHSGTVNQSDDRCTCPDGKLIDVDNLPGMHFTDGSVENTGILAVYIDRISVNLTVPGNNAV